MKTVLLVITLIISNLSIKAQVAVFQTKRMFTSPLDAHGNPLGNVYWIPVSYKVLVDLDPDTHLLTISKSGLLESYNVVYQDNEKDDDNNTKIILTCKGIENADGIYKVVLNLKEKTAEPVALVIYKNNTSVDAYEMTLTYLKPQK